MTVGVRHRTRSTKGLVDLGHYSPLKNLKIWAAAIIYMSYVLYQLWKAKRMCRVPKYILYLLFYPSRETNLNEMKVCRFRDKDVVLEKKHMVQKNLPKTFG